MHFGDICHAVGQEATEQFLVCEALPIVIAAILLDVLCKSVGKWVGTESPDTVLCPVTLMLFPLLVTSPVPPLSVFSLLPPHCLPVLFLALEPANTRHIFLGFWVKIQSLVTIQVSLKVSLLPCLQSPHICPIVLVWLGSALATRLNWESKYL